MTNRLLRNKSSHILGQVEFDLKRFPRPLMEADKFNQN